jgi:CBS domain-containing protein
MFVRDWMTSPAVALPAETRAMDALELMSVRKIRRVPVLEGDALVGILTQGDLLAALGPQENDPKRAGLRLGDLMTKSVRTVRPDDRVETAARVMLDHEISGLPVVDGGRVIGLITESDLFEAFARVMGRVRELAGGADLLALRRARRP